MTKLTKRAHYYRQERAHQAAVATNGSGMITTYPSGRTELSYASAPYGEHALSAWIAAKRRVYFMAQMRKLAA